VSFSSKDYTHIRFLKKGGQATLYRATHQYLMRQVVLKIYPSQDMQEARLGASLKHPGLVAIYDYGEENDAFYLSMEYLCGCTLQTLPKGILLSLECKVYLALQLVETLAFLHEQEVVHGDLSGSNVFITYKGEMKVLDLGMSMQNTHQKKESDFRNEVDPSHKITGTLLYLPPEHLSGNVQKTTAGDRYSLALIVAEIFMERPVFQELDKKKLLETIQQGSYTLEETIPSSLRKILESYLVKDPQKRPNTLQPLRDILKAMPSIPLDTSIQNMLKEYTLSQEKSDWKKNLEELEENKKWEAAFVEVKSRMAEYPHETEWLSTLQRLGECMNIHSSHKKNTWMWYIGGVLFLSVVLSIWLFVQSENSFNESRLIHATETNIGKKWFSSEESLQVNLEALQASKKVGTSKVQGTFPGSEKQAGLWTELVLPNLPKTYDVFLNGVLVQEYYYVSTSRWLQWKQGKYFLQINNSVGQEVYGDSLSLYSSEPVRVLW
jgi:serine/threonine protein kinase